MDVFFRIFSYISEQPFNTFCPEVFFKIAVLKYLRKLPGSYRPEAEVNYQLKSKECTIKDFFQNSICRIKTHHDAFKMFFKISQNSQENSRFSFLITPLKDCFCSQIISKAAVRGRVFLIESKYTTTDVFQAIFLNCLEQLF